MMTVMFGASMHIEPRRQRTCACAAYPFPHRAGSGKCDDPGQEPETCADCPHSVMERDPYCTGDGWFVATICGVELCPWGKE